MSPDRFDHLLSLVHDGLVKRFHIRKPISPEERLAVTLRYLATGDSQTSIGFLFKLGRSTVNGIIEEVCDELWRALSPEYVNAPATKGDWKKIASDFYELWNMPHCVGALDGKHIRMRKPSDSGSLWHNYKGYFSMVLLAICDSRYCFSFVDVGEYGSNNDSGVLKNSRMGKMFEREEMNLPESETIEGDKLQMPYFLVGDEIFPLKNWLMRPYSGKSLVNEKRKIFNYRLSRARRIIENTFGIMVARWRIFQTTINAEPERVEKIVFACVALHNYLSQTDNAYYTPFGFVDCESKCGDIIPGQWRSKIESNSLESIKPIRSIKYKKSAIQTRENLAKYFVTGGAVSWQLEYIRRTGNEE